MLPPRAFVLGHPISHSISPAIHNAAFELLGLPVRYGAWDVTDDELPGAVIEVRGPDVLGANVTVPHKERVIPLLDRIDPAAEVIGAVNTLYKRDGQLRGDNTDAAGFLRSVLEVGFGPRGASVLVLGAGGSARAVCHALLGAGVASIVIANRTLPRAEALARHLRSRHPAARVEPMALDGVTGSAVRDVDLLVNTTTVGMHEEASPLPAGLLPRGALMVDIIYNPPRTTLLRQAEAAGLRTLNGLPMLVYQAAAAFETWTGQSAPVAAMFAAARAALGQQHGA